MRKLEPNEMPNALLFALRLTEVSRWGIVATSRQQSVGEHCYRVCMTALAMYDYMENGTSHNSSDRADIAALAMTHDLFEIISGDLDSVFKMAMDARFPGLLATVEQGMATQRADSSALYDAVSSQQRASKNTIVAAVVKLADLVEALIYVDTYGTNQKHRQHVFDHILVKMWEKYETYTKQFPGYAWSRVEEFINLTLGEPGLQGRVKQQMSQGEGVSSADRMGFDHPAARAAHGVYGGSSPIK